MFSRRSFLGTSAVATGAAFLTGTTAFAAKPKVFAIDGIAIRGTDPVAYFTVGAATKGDAAHSSEHMGATWRFASAENKAMFDAEPEKYAPKYGGYCAFAVSKGATATTDPEAWSIVDDRLYLNYSLNVRKIWSEDIPGHIARADANWPGVLV